MIAFFDIGCKPSVDDLPALPDYSKPPLKTGGLPSESVFRWDSDLLLCEISLPAGAFVCPKIFDRKHLVAPYRVTGSQFICLHISPQGWQRHL